MSKLDDKDLTKVAGGGPGTDLEDLGPQKDRGSGGGGSSGSGDDDDGIEDLPGRGGGSRGVEQG